MLNHISNNKQKNFPFCLNETSEFKDEKEKKDKNKENICYQYCEKVKKLITDKETQIQCANEIMRDESFIQILSNLNNHTPQVINK